MASVDPSKYIQECTKLASLIERLKKEYKIHAIKSTGKDSEVLPDKTGGAGKGGSPTTGDEGATEV